MNRTAHALPEIHHAQFIPPGLAAIANGRDLVTNKEAAHILSRSEQTLRVWASSENGPIRPLRVHGRLMWKVVDLASLLNGG
ncbi:helix-turn-helix domain-containing protein [Cupriavidus pinatubonensis]|uniref:Helix-turn-helix domain-containing protein n=1 Tax=Cupriavidus pinatubonensis TaxID=248026 RepID=A0ABN7XTZ6_9BURK|nr:helix-turn-helix domain-containing protein [Cupriavidus pinatubonensis]CAG9163844.1 hypothetical protein LMG23994_00302 [Cupriavidus pinatubonensis]